MFGSKKFTKVKTRYYKKNPSKLKRMYKIPPGRTLSTFDNYIGRNKSSKKKRGVVVLETNSRDELAVVPLSTRAGSNRTKLDRDQDGKSYFKHYVEIEDDEGKPIKVGSKFRANHKNQDVSAFHVQLSFLPAAKALYRTW